MLTTYYLVSACWVDTAYHLIGEMIVQSVLSITTKPTIKCKSRTCLKAHAVTIIAVQTPSNLEPHKLYECGEKLQLLEGVIPPEVQHKFGHKMPLELKIPLAQQK